MKITENCQVKKLKKLKVFDIEVACTVNPKTDRRFSDTFIGLKSVNNPLPQERKADWYEENTFLI